MGKATGNVCLYLLSPEDTSCEGGECRYPKAVRRCKAVLWLCVSILVGVGLGRLC